MKFSNIKAKAVMLALTVLLSPNITLLKATNASEDKRLECGKKVGATLALCLFKLDDDLTFLDYIEQWKKIIKEYSTHFDQKIVDAITKALNDIEKYIKTQYAQGKKYINPNKIAAYLTRLTESLPATVSKQLDTTFEQLQLKLLKRSKPLETYQLLSPLSKRLNKDTDKLDH